MKYIREQKIQIKKDPRRVPHTATVVEYQYKILSFWHPNGGCFATKKRCAFDNLLDRFSYLPRSRQHHYPLTKDEIEYSTNKYFVNPTTPVSPVSPTIPGSGKPGKKCRYLILFEIKLPRLGVWSTCNTIVRIAR